MVFDRVNQIHGTLTEPVSHCFHLMYSDGSWNDQIPISAFALRTNTTGLSSLRLTFKMSKEKRWQTPRRIRRL